MQKKSNKRVCKNSLITLTRKKRRELRKNSEENPLVNYRILEEIGSEDRSIDD
jgi:hypothetical protein